MCFSLCSADFRLTLAKICVMGILTRGNNLENRRDPKALWFRLFHAACWQLRRRGAEDSTCSPQPGDVSAGCASAPRHCRSFLQPATNGPWWLWVGYLIVKKTSESPGGFLCCWDFRKAVRTLGQQSHHTRAPAARRTWQGCHCSSRAFDSCVLPTNTFIYPRPLHDCF